MATTKIPQPGVSDNRKNYFYVACSILLHSTRLVPQKTRLLCYTSEDRCMNGVETVKKNATTAEIVEIEE
jgi:hypothetical protein